MRHINKPGLVLKFLGLRQKSQGLGPWKSSGLGQEGVKQGQDVTLARLLSELVPSNPMSPKCCNKGNFSTELSMSSRHLGTSFGKIACCHNFSFDTCFSSFVSYLAKVTAAGFLHRQACCGRRQLCCLQSKRPIDDAVRLFKRRPRWFLFCGRTALLPSGRRSHELWTHLSHEVHAFPSGAFAQVSGCHVPGSRVICHG